MKYAFLAIAVLVLGTGFVVFFPRFHSDTTAAIIGSQTQAVPFYFPETEFDFGTIKQSGGKVEHAFPFTYVGSQMITVTGIPTSCGCTTSAIVPEVLTPGSKGVVTVTFDPNLHEEPDGHFYKTATMLTDPPLANLPELKIWAAIDPDLGQEFYRQKANHDD